MKKKKTPKCNLTEKSRGGIRGFEEDAFESKRKNDTDGFNLFILEEPKREVLIDAGRYTAKVGEISVTRRVAANDSTWFRVKIPFHISDPDTGMLLKTVDFYASKSMDENGRLYPIIKGILGKEPDIGMSLKVLENRKVRVRIEHDEFLSGVTREQIVSVKAVNNLR